MEITSIILIIFKINNLYFTELAAGSAKTVVTAGGLFNVTDNLKLCRWKINSINYIITILNIIRHHNVMLQKAIPARIENIPVKFSL